MSAPDTAGTAYLVHPTAGTGPGVLVLHSWWGLTAGAKAYCDRLADEGFVVLAPDLSNGLTPETAAEAEWELSRSDPNVTAGLILSSVVALRSQTDEPDGPVAVVGFSMGGSWALWLGTRQPDSVGAVVVHYGYQDVDFSDLVAPVLGHFATDDHLVTDDQLNEMWAHLRLLEHPVEFHRYPGTSHWFAEVGHPEDAVHDTAAATLAWERTVEFLRRWRPAPAGGP